MPRLVTVLVGLAGLTVAAAGAARAEPDPAAPCARGRAVAAADAASCDPDATRVEIVSTTPVPVEIDRFPGDVIQAPATLWLSAGTYRFTAILGDGSRLVSDLTIGPRSRATVLFEVPRPTPPRPPADQVLDFSDGEPAAAHAGAPPAHVHGSLLPERFARGVAASRRAAAVEDAPIDRAANRRAIGVRAASGVVDSATGAPYAISIGASYRTPVGDRLAIDARVDGIRRGAHARTGTPGVWTAGAGAYARWWPVVGRASSLSAVAGTRGEVRRIVGGEADLGASIAAGAALHLVDHRFSIELRGELGVIPLAGRRTTGAVIEVGLDL